MDPQVAQILPLMNQKLHGLNPKHGQEGELSDKNGYIIILEL
jgi:hypothetical protein